MQRLSAKQVTALELAVTAYEQHLISAASYLQGRGISREAAVAARLGVVVSPEPGHEHAAGRLAIPYLNKRGVTGIKFRCIQEHNCKETGCAKYLNVPGIETGLYNVRDVDAVSDVIHVCEGELDALVLRMVLDEPVVGVPGTQAWKPHHPFHFHGFERVLLWGDGDGPGRDLAARIRKEVPVAELVPLPDGHDVNSLFLAAGAGRLRELAGLQEVEA